MVGGMIYTLLFMTCIWIVLFVLCDHLRKEQLITSIATSILFPIILFVIEKKISFHIPWLYILLLFFMGGIASIVYHAIFGQYYIKTPRHLVHKHATEEIWAWKWIGMILGAMCSTILFAYIWPHLPLELPFLFTAILFLLYYMIARQDLFFDAIMSAGLMISLFAMTDIVFGQFSSQMLTSELYIHATALGIFFGPLYEFARNTNLSHVTSSF